MTKVAIQGCHFLYVAKWQSYNSLLFQVVGNVVVVARLPHCHIVTYRNRGNVVAMLAFLTRKVEG